MAQIFNKVYKQTDSMAVAAVNEFYILTGSTSPAPSWVTGAGLPIWTHRSNACGEVKDPENISTKRSKVRLVTRVTSRFTSPSAASYF